jgi:hypothetical protein
VTAPPLNSHIPLAIQIEEVSRELGARRRLYPRWIREGRLPEEVALHRMLAMEAVLGTLRQLEQPELALGGL